MATITLPSKVYENQLVGLIELLQAPGRDPVALDFSRVSYYIPAAIVTVMAIVRNWLNGGRQVFFRNLEECHALSYLQRMDFFSTLGLEIPENFKRHAPSGNFVTIREITTQTDVSMIARECATCVSHGSEDAKCLVEYATAELVLNCIQHANGTGYVTAQYAPGRDMARIGIADCGIGLRSSFESSGSGFFFPGMSDSDAIDRALAPEVSSKTHQPDSPNRGVGLSMTRKLMEDSKGTMFIASGQSWWVQDGVKSPRRGVFREDATFTGTVVSAAFQRDQILLFFEMMKTARIELGLQKPDHLQDSEDFDSMFL